MNQPPYMIYDNTIELAFEFEKLIRQNKPLDNTPLAKLQHPSPNYTISDIIIWFDAINVKMIENNKYAYLLKLEFNDSSHSGSKSKFAFDINEIIELFNMIPLYNLSLHNAGATDFNCADIDDEVLPVNEGSRLYSELRELRTNNFDILTENASKQTNIKTIEKILQNHEIPYTKNDENLMLYEPELRYQILILTTFQEDCKYIIRPDLQTFYTSLPFSRNERERKIISLGTFVKHKNSYISHAIESHLAIIVKCPKCSKNIVIDWFTITRNLCPYCGFCKFAKI